MMIVVEKSPRLQRRCRSSFGWAGSGNFAAAIARRGGNNSLLSIVLEDMDHGLRQAQEI